MAFDAFFLKAVLAEVKDTCLQGRFCMHHAEYILLDFVFFF